jgi:hypothetical protein
MSLWRSISYGLRNLIRRGQRDRDSHDEVAQYFAEAEAEARARGLSPEQARRAVRLDAGNVAVVKERVNSYGWENAVRSFGGDLRFAARQLKKNPVFAATATLTLALGIGANAAIFTVIQSVLLAPLPYTNPARLAVIQTHWSDTGHTSSRVTGGDAVDIREQASGLQAISLYAGGNIGVLLRDHSTYTMTTWVDENFARVFSLQPIAGRLFTNDESHRSALVSETFARNNFGSTQAALGQTMHIESEAIEIVGVLPASFDFPDKSEVWEAFPLHPDVALRFQLSSRCPSASRCRLRYGKSRA